MHWDCPLSTFSCHSHTGPILLQVYNTLSVVELPVYRPNELEQESPRLFGEHVRSVMAEELQVLLLALVPPFHAPICWLCLSILPSHVLTQICTQTRTP